MSVRTDVLLWAQRVLAKADAAPHVLLEIRENAAADVVSDAFQKIARMAHPDLHRTGLTPEELEMVTSAYSRVAGAYQQMRALRAKAAAQTASAAAAPADAKPKSVMQQRIDDHFKGQTPSTGSQATKSPTSDVAAHSMNPKALLYYRKAELVLRRGDLRNGILQLKMAIASDPSSQFLRTVLTQVEAELAKKP